MNKAELYMYIAVTIITIFSFGFGVWTNNPMIGLSFFFACNVGFVIVAHMWSK